MIDNIDLDNLDDSQRLFLKEFQTYNRISSIGLELGDNSFLKGEIGKIKEDYYNLLNQVVKLVKISDSTQLNLKKAKAKLKEQNGMIANQNEELMKSLEVREQLLKVIERELTRAADYVKSILPVPMKSGNFRIDWRFIPSSKLGGDSFGYQKLDEKRYAFYLLDVCGHGVRSALYSVSVMNTINYQSIQHADFYEPLSVMSNLNKMFDMRAHNDLYFTIWYGVYNTETRELKYSSAGHPPGILISKNGNSKLLQTENFFIGGVPDYEFEQSRTLVAPNDTLYLYSDGAYEIRKTEHDYMTIEDCANYLAKNNSENDSVLDSLYDYINSINYDQNLEDDFSIMKVLFV